MSIFLAPGNKNITVSSECTSTCTARSHFSNLTLISNFFHAHKRANWLLTQHIRDSIQLPDIGKISHYDMSFQNIKMLANPIPILPGDRLITTCGYDTSQDSTYTHGGLSSNDEMCFNFVEYYPARKDSEITYCSSNNHYRSDNSWESHCGESNSILLNYDPTSIGFKPLPERFNQCSSAVDIWVDILVVGVYVMFI
jgi:hypothetical protein